MISLFLRAALVCVLCGLGAAQASPQSDNDIQLPDLGDSSSSIFSLDQEYQLGRAWLMAFRSQVKVIDDPLMQDYLENIIYELATYSELKDRRLDIVIVDNPTINAFAVPGGVVGVHNGLFFYADNEAQFASVLAHELAHLSQRHFARSVDAQRRGTLPNLAGMLAGIILAATAGGDAGIAAITATQAASLQNQLRYSRLHEQEADRIGMQTLIRADMDPNSFAAMFEKILLSTRYAGTRPPEFLLTHPVTESRISDARNRARQLPKQVHTDSLDYQLMKARAEIQLSTNTRDTLNTIESKLQRDPSSTEADRYALVLALMANNNMERASKEIRPLIEQSPQRIAYIIANAEIGIARGAVDQSINDLKKALLLSPGNHPLTMSLARALLKDHQPHLAEQLLQEHIKRRPADPSIWYLLAETHGLAGNIVGVHQARAEYFVLNGVLDRAIQQLNYALPLVANNQPATAKISERIKQITQLRKQLDAL